MVVIIKYIIKIIAFQLGVCPSPIYQRTGPQHDWRNGDYPLSRTDIQQGSSDYRILLTSNEAPPIHDRPHLLNPGAAGTPSTHGSTRYSKYTSTYFAIYTTSSLYAGMVHEYIYIYIIMDERSPISRLGTLPPRWSRPCSRQHRGRLRIPGSSLVAFAMDFRVACWRDNPS